MAEDGSFEKVHTVHEWFDGPRAGFADFRGTPHVYLCAFDDARDGWSELYTLAPVDATVFALALEDFSIWRRWQAAFHAGAVQPSSGPALPEDRARSDELKAALRPVLAGTLPPVARARPEFRRCGTQDGPREPYDLEVRWHATEQA